MSIPTRCLQGEIKRKYFLSFYINCGVSKWTIILTQIQNTFRILYFYYFVFKQTYSGNRVFLFVCFSYLNSISKSQSYITVKMKPLYL